MDRKKGIAYMCIIVLVMMVVGSYLSRGYLPPAPESLKREIQQERERLCPDVTVDPFVWFDENGGKREPGVMRYVGIYGDCSVILAYEDPHDLLGWPEDPPFELIGLNRWIETPVKCALYLFNHNPDCKLPGEGGTLATRLCSLEYAKMKKLEWLTDAQLEQLNCDLEVWFAAGNY